MNTEISEIESDSPETPPEDTAIKETPAKESKPRRGGGALSAFAFLFSLAALSGTAWMWWQDQAATGQEEQRVFAEIGRLENSDSELALKLSQLRDEVESLAGGDIGDDLDALQRRLEADRSKMQKAEQVLTEQQALSRSLQAATDSMHGRLAAAEAALNSMTTRELDAGGELDIAEVDYLLRLANERVKLFSDPQAADQALEVADMHLDALDNPLYLGVRQDIAAARRALASVEMPDYLELSGQLDSIQEQMATLPFAEDDAVAKSAGQNAGDGWWEKIKGVFSNLVTVRRSTDQENERISLEDKDYVRQRTWLQLEIAHLSLMRRDQEAFRHALLRVQETLSAWFDSGSEAYQTIDGEIEGLLKVEVQVEAPDITKPWNSLRLLKAPMTRPTPVPVPEAETQPEQEPEPESEPQPEPEPPVDEPATEAAGE